MALEQAADTSGFAMVMADEVWRHALMACMTHHITLPSGNSFGSSPIETWTKWDGSMPPGVNGNEIARVLGKIVPDLMTFHPCPACSLKNKTILSVVIHLNDGHGWTREKIADWLETLDIDLTIQPLKKKEKESYADPNAIQEQYIQLSINKVLDEYAGVYTSTPAVGGGKGTDSESS